MKHSVEAAIMLGRNDLAYIIIEALVEGGHIDENLPEVGQSEWLAA